MKVWMSEWAVFQGEVMERWTWWALEVSGGREKGADFAQTRP
jgi:hypothetical protein